MFTRISVSLGFLCSAVALCLAVPNHARAQSAPPGSSSPQTSPDRQAQQVQLAVPFGTVDGQLVISGRNLMFIDQQHPGGSFTVSRDDVRNINAQGSDMTIDLVRPVQNSGGPTNRLVFRMVNPTVTQNVAQWFHEGQTASSQQTGTADRGAPNAPQVIMSFQVKHDHRFGSDMGRLLVTPGQVSYESVTSVNNSRQWNLSDIKEVRRDGPYKLKIVPFSGDDYNFELLGQGMSSDQYQMLVDAVTRARISRHD